MKIKVIAKTERGKTALEEHILESQDKFIIEQLKKKEIEQKIILKPLTVIIEWKASSFLEMIKELKQYYPRQLEHEINKHKIIIIKTMTKNGAENYIDYEIEVEV